MRILTESEGARERLNPIYSYNLENTMFFHVHVNVVAPYVNSSENSRKAPMNGTFDEVYCLLKLNY